MSFLNIDVEAQIHNKGNVSQTSLIVEKASNLLTDFANGVNGMERLINQMGTKRDSAKLRDVIENEKIKELGEYKQQLEHLTNDISHLITTNKDASTADKFSEEKLRNEFLSISKNFSYLKRQFIERKNSIVLTQKLSTLEDSANESTPLISQQQQQQQLQQSYTINQQDLDLHTVLAEEREADIKKIHGGVEEINTIYKHLGQLVQQQGSHIDTIENNLTHYSNNTERATQELTKADNYQKNKGKWSCIILVVLAVITLVAVLAIIS